MLGEWQQTLSMPNKMCNMHVLYQTLYACNIPDTKPDTQHAEQNVRHACTIPDTKPDTQHAEQIVRRACTIPEEGHR